MEYSHNKEIVVSVLTRPPDKAPLAPKRIKKRLMRFMAVGTGVMLALFGVGSIIARASFTNLYPATCNGGWNGVERATLKPDLELNAHPEAFNEMNSAVFSGGADKHIECSWAHDVEEVVHAKILRVKLNLSWVFKAVTPVPSPDSTSSPQEDPVPTSTSEPSTTTGSDSVPVAPTPDVAPAPSVPDVAPVAPSVSEPAVVPPTPAPEPATTPTEPQAFFPFMAVAHAQENAAVPNVTASLVFNGIEHFLTIEYSIDGTEWKPVDNADLELPLTSWEDMQKTRVRITVLKDEPGLPQIFLDGMWLEAMYIPQDVNTESESGGDSATSTATSTDATASTLDTITGLAEDALQAITDLPSAIGDLLSPDEPSTPQISASTLTAPNTVFPVEPKVEFQFGIPGEPVLRDSHEPNIIPGVDGTSLVITGECGMKYYTVLLFANPDDYRGDPTHAIVNRAGLCEGGKYRFELQSTMLPSVLTGGTYYLLLTEQEEQKPWTIGSNPIRPIEITPHVTMQ